MIPGFDIGMKPILRLSGSVVLVLVLSGCTQDDRDNARIDVRGDWKVEVIGDARVIEDSPATISFEDEQRVDGNASCNRYFGSYTLERGKLELSQLGSTMMICSELLMEQEDRFLRALGEVSQAESVDNELILKDEQGKILIRGSRTFDQ